MNCTEQMMRLKTYTFPCVILKAFRAHKYAERFQRNKTHQFENALEVDQNENGYISC